MSENREGADSSTSAVFSGVVALVAVAVLIGAILAGGAFVASQALGLDAGDGAAARSTRGETLYLPEPSETEESDTPYITLGPGRTPSPRPIRPSDSETPDSEITLVAAQTAVGQMEPIDLRGTYPGGEGSILQVQQFENGAWSDFPVTIPVDATDFATFIQASAIGPNRFRVIDTDTQLASNEVEVQIG